MRWRPWTGCCGSLAPTTSSPSRHFRSDRRSSATCATGVAFRQVPSGSARWSGGRENNSDAPGARVALRGRDRQSPAGLEVVPGVGRLVDAQLHDVSGPRPAERGVDGRPLIDYDLGALDPAPGGRFDPLHDVLGDLTTPASTRVCVLADDEVVEDASRHPTELANVLVPPI